MLDLQERGSGISLKVRVQPRASRNAIDGELDGALRVRLTALPVDDRANEALCAYLAELLKRPKSAVRILGGARSRTKVVEIAGVARSEVEALLRFEA
jgi:uncharacterized protein (TIGR00251 family)